MELLGVLERRLDLKSSTLLSQQTRSLQEFNPTRTESQWLMVSAFGIFVGFVFIER